MKLWLILLRGDDHVWVEDAWDDDSTAENREGWEDAVDKARDLAASAKYQMRIVAVTVPWDGIEAAFAIPELEARIA